EIILGETDTFVFTCRCIDIGHPVIHEIKNDLKVAGHKKKETPMLVDILSELFPRVEPAGSVIETGLSNIGMIFHPLPTLMNITGIEAKRQFRYYLEGITPLVSRVLEQLDEERLAVAKAIGINVQSAYEWLKDRYSSEGQNLYERIQNTHAYQNVFAPTDIDTRYIFEDIQTGFVPVSCLGKRVNIPTEIMDSSIKWASVVYNTDFQKTGRNETIIDFDEMLSEAY
ncbi:MAG: NAD/NADP octopine/nopaline dehydrogenase family protein, partial [Clostridia bacterium]